MNKPKYHNKEWLYQKYWTERLSLAQIGEICGVSHGVVCGWMKKCGIKRRTYREATKGKYHPMWGKHHSEASKKMMSLNKMGFKHSDESRKKMALGLSKALQKKGGNRLYYKKSWLHQKYIVEQLSMTQIGKLCNVDSSSIFHFLKKYNILARTQGEAVTLFYKKNPDAAMRGPKNPNYGKKLSTKQKEQIRRTSKKNWKDPEYVEKCLKATEKRPTFPEKLFDEMTPNEIRYVGNHAYWRTFPDGKHRNPDFKITGQNKVIEVWGKYWHEGEDPKKLINQYQEVGLDCLVFWDYEIFDNPERVIDETNHFFKEG